EREITPDSSCLNPIRSVPKRIKMEPVGKIQIHLEIGIATLSNPLQTKGRFKLNNGISTSKAGLFEIAQYPLLTKGQARIEREFGIRNGRNSLELPVEERDIGAAMNIFIREYKVVRQRPTPLLIGTKSKAVYH